VVEQVLELMEQDLDGVERQYVSRVLKEHGDKFSPSDLALWCVNTKNELHSKLQVIIFALYIIFIFIYTLYIILIFTIYIIFTKSELHAELQVIH
jgi:hypothetical protein